MKSLARLVRPRFAARYDVKSGPGDAFLRSVDAVLHVGANLGQERQQYADAGLRVVWVEPIPHIYAQLKRNISAFPDQVALQYLLTDSDGESVDFKVTNNDGQSSSIFDIAQHADIWPDVRQISTIRLETLTLASMVEREQIALDARHALVMDVQGAELLVLKGAGGLVTKFDYIKAEAADFESYAGCCVVDDLMAYLAQFGFEVLEKRPFAERPGGGTYYDLLFERRATAS